MQVATSDSLLHLFELASLLGHLRVCRGLSYTGSSELAGVSATIGTGAGTETLESGVDGSDPTVGSGESGTFSSTGGVATDGSITSSPNELLSKMLGNECSISANCGGKKFSKSYASTLSVKVVDSGVWLAGFNNFFLIGSVLTCFGASYGKQGQGNNKF